MAAQTPHSERVALVTGSTSGIGREIARGLAADGGTVLVHGRDREKGRRVVDELADETGNDDVHLFTADLGDVDAVREFAAAVREAVDRLDVFVANAGTWQHERHLVEFPGCSEGVELTFAVNHLGHFLLTHLLVDHLAAGGSDDGTGGEAGDDGVGPTRVVVVSSEVHQRAELDLDAVVGPDGPSGVDAYALSKLANVMFTYELARRLPEGVIANCCHPGTVPSTALDRDGSVLGRLGWRLMGALGTVVDITESPAEAARTPLYLATSPEVADRTGVYFEACERARSAEAAYDRTAQRDLWAKSETWVALEEDERLDA